MKINQDDKKVLNLTRLVVAAKELSESQIERLAHAIELKNLHTNDTGVDMVNSRQKGKRGELEVNVVETLLGRKMTPEEKKDMLTTKKASE